MRRSVCHPRRLVRIELDLGGGQSRHASQARSRHPQTTTVIGIPNRSKQVADCLRERDTRYPEASAPSRPAPWMQVRTPMTGCSSLASPSVPTRTSFSYSSIAAPIRLRSRLPQGEPSGPSLARVLRTQALSRSSVHRIAHRCPTKPCASAEAPAIPISYHLTPTRFGRSSRRTADAAQ